MGPEEDDPTIRMPVGEITQGLPASARPGPAPVPPPPPSSVAASDGAAPLFQAAHVAVPPPLPSAPQASDQTPMLALEVPASPGAFRRLASKDRLLKIGGGLFALGVLVGVVGSVIVMAGGSDGAVEVGAPAALPTGAPPRAAAARPGAVAIEAGAYGVRAEPEAEPAPVERRDPAQEANNRLVSLSIAPSCNELLGDELITRNAPRAAEKEAHLAKRALVRGNVDQAQAAYCKAFAWDKENVDRHVSLGRLFLVRRDWEKAAEYGKSALELDPKNRSALGVVGDAWAALHRTEQARAAWLAAEKKPNPTRRDLRLIARRSLALARQVERMKDYLSAERLYRRVLLLDPQHPDAMKGIVRCLLRVGDPQAAEAWARKAKGLRLSG